ncbi:MAG: phosphoglycolate phosphatase [Rhodospirillaceae bacterium]|nr:MAG: phosphoglycolate phosphatase [Rhodospirillaceae bacterium]
MSQHDEYCIIRMNLDPKQMTEAKIGHLSALIFDLDGTLIDSAPDLQAAANRMLPPLGRREVDVKEIQLMIGDGVPKLVERCFAATGDIPPADELAEHAAKFTKDYEPRSAELTVAFDGSHAVLQKLKDRGLKLSICTNKPYGATMQILKSLELAQYFDVVIGGDTLPGIKKPDPRHLIAALEAMDASSADSAMVGDNQNDVNAAHAAGLPVVLLSHGYTKTPVTELGGEAVIDHFDDLEASLEALNPL